ncbi:dual specificity protein phosphatase [Stylonychia lemnae]|uniref:Dual specificity protein phosphatase n=1 Tax=Stylonychia lemnae TaxID=5949 RepID=A0A077ZUN6_STYLE|nr:dual specificity protein phosphatase [Stylonychia lemnae]|eukprot:CDW73259.1 dual specificity protein phosphatase [Stylonychia lemnae]
MEKLEDVEKQVTDISLDDESLASQTSKDQQPEFQTSQELTQQNQGKQRKQQKQQKPKKDSVEEINKLGFCPLGCSKITLWHKPAIADIKLLKELKGINLIVTLLYDKENPFPVIEECKNQDIENFRIPLKGASDATLKDPENIAMIVEKLTELFDKLTQKEYNVLIHCSAGVHRTGTIGYTLMRMNGLDQLQSHEALKQMREQTFLDVGENRMQIAEQNYIPLLLKNDL